jgi:hypothetical protein
MNDYGETTW